MNPHLVILRHDHLGDMLLTTPLVRSLGAAGWRVTVMGKRAWAGVWVNHPHADYQAEEDICPEFPKGWFTISRWLRKVKPTHILVPYYHRELLRASFFSGCKNRYSQMCRWEGRLTLHRPLRAGILETPRHMADVWQDFVEVVGVSRTSTKPELFLTAEERANANRRIAEKIPGNLPLVIIHPFHGGSSCHPAMKDYVEVARSLQKSGRCRMIVTGVAKEKDVWQQAAAGLMPENLWVSCGELSLRELFAVVGAAQRVVCGSTGLLHIASALDVPAVSIFCPHPAVNDTLWGNPVPGTVVLSPKSSACPRVNGDKVSNCGLRNGPAPSEITDAVLKQLSHAGVDKAGIKN